MTFWNVFLSKGKFLGFKCWGRLFPVNLSKEKIVRRINFIIAVKISVSTWFQKTNFKRFQLARFVAISACFFWIGCNNSGYDLNSSNAILGKHNSWEKFENYELPQQVDSFPYVKESNHQEIVEKPNIFFVFLRSCNASFIEAKNGKGLEFTPNINKLKRLGLSVENFYGNSTKAALGQFAVLSGINPGFINTNQVFNLKMNPLTRILERNEFSTFLFDGTIVTERFVNPKDFQYIESIEVESLSNEEKLNCWGKGLRDDFLYKRAFHKLDQWYQQNGKKKRVFGVISPVSHYHRFRDLPDSLKFLYPHPKDELEMFSNSIYLEDLYIKTFFAELGKRSYLKNSLIVVVGINSYPAGEHGYSNKNGWYEDRFKVPLMLIWPGNILPGKVRDIAYSQIDVAPTILELIGVSAKNHFTGRSIMDTLRRDQKPIYLTQPADGKYLAVVKFPFKYVKNEHSGQELLFNLIEDPLEEKNLIDNNKYQEALASLREDFSFFYFNQTILDQNRVWYPTVLDEDV